MGAAVVVAGVVGGWVMGAVVFGGKTPVCLFCVTFENLD